MSIRRTFVGMVGAVVFYLGATSALAGEKVCKDPGHPPFLPSTTVSCSVGIPTQVRYIKVDGGFGKFVEILCSNGEKVRGREIFYDIRVADCYIINGKSVKVYYYPSMEPNWAGE